MSVRVWTTACTARARTVKERFCATVRHTTSSTRPAPDASVCEKVVIMLGDVYSCRFTVSDLRRGFCYLEAPDYGRDWCSLELGGRVSQATCCCSSGRGRGEEVDICTACPHLNTSIGRFNLPYRCMQVSLHCFRVAAEFDELCPGGVGYRPNVVTTVLEDIDECSELPNLCRGGRCRNTYGSFVCECSVGFMYDEVTGSCVGKQS